MVAAGKIAEPSLIAVCGLGLTGAARFVQSGGLLLCQLLID
jgi:hypothetical protein